MDSFGKRAAAVRRKKMGRARGAARRSGQGGGDRRRLIQLVVSLSLFLLVYIGRGVFPEQIQVWRQLLTADVDLSAAWGQFQQDLAQGEDFQQALSQLGAAVLGSPAQEGPEPSLPAEPTLLSQTSRLGLDYADQAGVRKAVAQSVPQQMEQEQPAPSDDQPEPSPEIVTAVAQAYTDEGVALPSNVSFAYYELGLEETVVPVQGSITSNFGYRESPIHGKNEFHLALDIGAAEGTEIEAFADGVVEYIGESDEFGLYLQIQHANNVATFYAHCSKLLVSKGDTVQCGDTVALVGATGNVTGPHLHFTLLKDGIRLDPAYYVQLP